MPFDPEVLKNKIRQSLAQLHSGEDLRLRVGNNDYGFWLWDEVGESHIHATSAFIKWALGATLELETQKLNWESLT